MQSWIRISYLLLVLIATAILGYMFGYYTKRLGWMPNVTTHLESALKVYYDLFDDEWFKSNAWKRARTPAKGVVQHDSERAYEGVTLYVSASEQAAVLIDMEGNEVYRWQRTFREIWPKAPHISIPRSPELIVYNNARVFPNGDLIVQFRGDGGNPWGYGLVKLDKDSNVIWRLAENAHHFFDVDADGNVYALTHVNRDSPYQPSKELKFGAMSSPYKINLPTLEDFLVILAPDGSVKKRISLLDAFVDSPYEGALTYFGANTDVLHANDVDVVPDDIVENPIFKPGQALINMRDPGTLAVLDLETAKIVWAKRGAWRGQHDPDILPDGNVLMVDSRGALGKGGETRIIEVKPGTGEVLWSYEGDEAHPLDSRLQSTVQRLPNDNTLITEWAGGRMLEVTMEGDIVWEYVVPVRRSNKGMEFHPVINAGQRIKLDQLHFLKH